MRGLGWGPRVPADPRVALTGSGSARGRPRVPGAMGRRASDPVWWGDGGEPHQDGDPPSLSKAPVGHFLFGKSERSSLPALVQLFTNAM